MIKQTAVESEKLTLAFLESLKKSTKKDPKSVEFFELKLKEPIYEKLNCAFLQTADKKQGLLYEAVTNRFFYIRSEKGGTPTLSSLTKSVNSLFPKGLKDKMFWVCGNRKDKGLEIGDFDSGFELKKA